MNFREILKRDFSTCLHYCYELSMLELFFYLSHIQSWAEMVKKLIKNAALNIVDCKNRSPYIGDFMKH